MGFKVRIVCNLRLVVGIVSFLPFVTKPFRVELAKQDPPEVVQLLLLLVVGKEK